MHHKIQKDAIFIADAHYQVGVRESFYEFLLKIDNREIKTSQLIMMGDMFDLLVGSIAYTTKENQKVITLLNALSQQVEILYFEGNHDFDLQRLFPKLTIIPLSKQPYLAFYHDKRIILSHGDLYQGLNYTLYTYLIRHPLTLKFLNMIDKNFNNFISKSILEKQRNKKLCRKLQNFAQFIKQKSKNYDIAHNRFDLICEGHHHMDEEYHLEGCYYKLFSSYACGNIYYTIDFKERIVFTPHKG